MTSRREILVDSRIASNGQAWWTTVCAPLQANIYKISAASPPAHGNHSDADAAQPGMWRDGCRQGWVLTTETATR